MNSNNKKNGPLDWWLELCKTQQLLSKYRESLSGIEAVGIIIALISFFEGTIYAELELETWREPPSLYLSGDNSITGKYVPRQIDFIRLINCLIIFFNLVVINSWNAWSRFLTQKQCKENMIVC